MASRNVSKGKQFERFLANLYGKATGRAARTGHMTVMTRSGYEVPSGVNVVLGPFAAQAKKGPSFYPKKIREALDKATRDCGRRIPLVIAADDGENLDHIVVMRGRDFKRVYDMLEEHGLSDGLLLGAGMLR